MFQCWIYAWWNMKLNLGKLCNTREKKIFTLQDLLY
jgi:hypothetical protein